MPDTELPKYRCCEHCADDPQYHEDNPVDSHTASCGLAWCPTGNQVVK